MRIKVWGAQESVAELLEKGCGGHELVTEELDLGDMQRCDLFIDLDPDGFYSRLDLYEQFYPIPVLLNSVKDTLSHVLQSSFGNKDRFSLFGFNGLQTFIRSSVAEVSVLHEGFAPQLKALMAELGWDYRIVDDQVGMVSPRVVVMIINEAYFSVQAGTASREDIDTAMRLGTRYPYGPFDWCRRIGVQHVYELLRRLQEVTGDERYRSAALLQKEYSTAMAAAGWPGQIRERWH